MPLVPQMTVNDAIKKIAVRLGFADQGTARSRAETRIQGFIEQAIHELAREVVWDDNVFEVRIPLITGQDRYEFPEESKAGELVRIEVEDTRSTRYELEGGIRTQEFAGKPEDDTYRVPVGDPLYWRIIDREIQIMPAPIDAERIPNLVMTLKRSVPLVIETGTLLPFDSELIIQRCVVLGRRHFQLPGQDDAEADYAAYLARVKAAQGAPATFYVGGNKSHYVTRDKRVYENPLQRRDRGQNAPYTPNWTPW